MRLAREVVPGGGGPRQQVLLLRGDRLHLGHALQRVGALHPVAGLPEREAVGREHGVAPRLLLPRARPPPRAPLLTLRERLHLRQVRVPLGRRVEGNHDRLLPQLLPCLRLPDPHRGLLRSVQEPAATWSHSSAQNDLRDAAGAQRRAGVGHEQRSGA